MTVLEQEFKTLTPRYLREIAHELKRMNDLKEKEIALKERDSNGTSTPPVL